MDITIDHADLVEMGPGQRVWMLGLIVDDNGETLRILHVLPEETLENMVVEYDLDPTDFDTVLEAALYLPFVADPITHDHPKAPHLVAEPSEAREHLLQQVRLRKGAGRIKGKRGQSEIGAVGPQMRHLVVEDSGEDDPLEVLRRRMPLSTPHIAVKQEAYTQVRRRVVGERAKRAAERRTSRERESPGQLRKWLERVEQRGRLVGEQAADQQ